MDWQRRAQKGHADFARPALCFQLSRRGLSRQLGRRCRSEAPLRGQGRHAMSFWLQGQNRVFSNVLRCCLRPSGRWPLPQRECAMSARAAPPLDRSAFTVTTKVSALVVPKKECANAMKMLKGCVLAAPHRRSAKTHTPCGALQALQALHGNCSLSDVASSGAPQLLASDMHAAYTTSWRP